MKTLDVYLQNVRFSKAKKFIRQGDSVLDIGSDDGIMFEKLAGLIGKGVGIEPKLEKAIEKNNYKVLPGFFPDACPPGEKYDAITMLAVLEHIPKDIQAKLAADCSNFLKPGGCVIITVPSPQVDLILAVLSKLRLIDGMSLDEHYGFKPSDTEEIFGKPRFKLLHKERFQLGLNNLFVFEKVS